MSAPAASAGDVAADSAAAAWARSGLMALSGPADGAPALPAFDAMAGIAALLRGLEASAARAGCRVHGDLRWLTERAALQRLTRRGRVSCNGSCRLIATRDGWIAVNLPREADLECVPAWVGAYDGADPWAAIARGAVDRSSAVLVESARRLGLAVAPVEWPEPHEVSRRCSDEIVPLLRVQQGRAAGARDWNHAPPLVIDLSALWAGPLCGHLLQSAGARVIKVESAGRADSVRQALPAFFNLLNAGKESVMLDFTSAADRARLHALIAHADVVIGSARPRAFEQLGLEPERLIEHHAGLTWVAITAQGWTGAARNAVGFGDDAAAAGGLLSVDRDGFPLFAGDALADPLTGIAAAAGAFTALAAGGGVIVDASLARVAAFVAAGRRLRGEKRGRVERRDGEWWLHVEGRTERIAPPRARQVTGAARDFGADTARVLAEFRAAPCRDPEAA